MSDEVTQIGMTVFRVNNLDNWQARIIAAASKGSGKAIRKGSGCVLWDPAQLVSGRGSLKHADGVKVVRQWLGPKSGAVAIIPQRVYFEGDSNVPSAKPEWSLVGDAKPALPSPSKRLATCLKWAQLLGTQMPGFAAAPLPIGRVRTGLHQGTAMIFGGGVQGLPGQKPSILLTRHGFHSVPTNMRIELVVEDVANANAKLYRGLIADAFRRCKCPVTVSTVSFSKMRARLSGDAAVIDAMRENYCALVAVTGKRGKPLSQNANTLIEALQLSCVSFRMFSLENRSLNWSALDQVGSLLMGAGGIPYAVKLPWPVDAEPPYVLGVDLGHPKAKRDSWVVMSLMDPRGVLVESWRRRQERDETIGPRVLKAGLTWAREAARVHNGGRDAAFLVIRDGRLHEGETVQAYLKVLGTRLTFLELAKYDNPEMFIPGENPRPVPTGTECLVEGSVTPFIVPVSPRLAGDLSRALKIHMAPPWDGLGLGIDKVSEIVTGLSYTPGLGLATHALPGPIYWADGIAAIGETNHQFAGQRIRETTI